MNKTTATGKVPKVKTIGCYDVLSASSTANLKVLVDDLDGWKCSGGIAVSVVPRQNENGVMVQYERFYQAVVKE